MRTFIDICSLKLLFSEFGLWLAVFRDRHGFILRISLIFVFYMFCMYGVRGNTIILLLITIVNY